MNTALALTTMFTVLGSGISLAATPLPRTSTPKSARQCVGVNGLRGKQSGIYCKQCFGVSGLPGKPSGIICKYVPIAS